MSTHNLCFTAIISKNVYPCTPQFYYIKVGCEEVLITRTRYPDAYFFSHISGNISSMKKKIFMSNLSRLSRQV